MKQISKLDFLSKQQNFLLYYSDFYISDCYLFDSYQRKELLRISYLITLIKKVINSYEIDDRYIDCEQIVAHVINLIHETINHQALLNLFTVVCTEQIENHYVYSKLAAAFLIESQLDTLFQHFESTITYEHDDIDLLYRESFKKTIRTCCQENTFSERLLEFNLEELADYLELKRDRLFEYIGIYTLSKRFFIKTKENKIIIETPQGFWMRVAMGLALNEEDKNQKAKEFYDVLSLLRYVPSTPTLCHSGFKIPQLSSCYLNVVEDDLHEIFNSFRDSAQLSKWSGGIGTCWSKVRASGAMIKKINLESQGVIPYLKIEDDIVSSISKTGTRRGGKAVYLDIWHYDVEAFLDLKKNTGDHRRRTHDLNTALWISDIFMERLLQNGTWTLFSPDEVPELLTVYGKKFELAYQAYETGAKSGIIKLCKTVSARDLWKKILTRIFETGHPWITFKDPSNIRSPQQHCGMVHSSNLCTEITLNTSAEETAVCNIGSLNLVAHTDDNGEIDRVVLEHTIRTALRMLDNVIDLTYYPVPTASYANKKHRPVGLGVMGWQDVLFKKGLAFEDQAVPLLMNEVSEFISFCTISSSVDLAKERGAYESFYGSLWQKGIFPHETVALLNDERKTKLDMPPIVSKLNWRELKEKMKLYGMRNSNTMAIAPTATISTIAGTVPSIEPIYKNLYVKSNITGEFSIINNYLVNALEKTGLWNADIKNKIKFFDGSIQSIAEIPFAIRSLFKTAFEIDQKYLLYLAALRGQWIDQSQSTNIFFEGTSGKLLDEIYTVAWKLGLKTSYYLRTVAKSQIEKSTLGVEFGLTQMRTKENSVNKSCTVLNSEECESCQ